LLDFSAAPAGGACARLDAESYEDQKTAEFIGQSFLPVKAPIKEHPAWFHRFDAVWTPTVLLLDSEGKDDLTHWNRQCGGILWSDVPHELVPIYGIST
jgi:hypothetical protein